MPVNIAAEVAEYFQSEHQITVPENLYDTELVQVPGSTYDSLKVLEVITFLEERFDVDIDMATDDVQFTLSSVTQIADLVRRKQNARIS